MGIIAIDRRCQNDQLTTYCRRVYIAKRKFGILFNADQFQRQFPGELNWHDIDTSIRMMQFLKYFCLENKVEAIGFKLVPAFTMILLFLLFHAYIIYILLSTMFGS